MRGWMILNDEGMDEKGWMDRWMILNYEEMDEEGWMDRWIDR